MPLINIGGKDYHVVLTDRSGTQVGLNLVNGRGQDDALEISQSNHPRTPLQTSQGQGEYSDLLLPYKELVQSDWSGGRASLNFRKDQTRYLDAGNLDTEIEEQVILRGAPHYTTGMHTITQSIPGDVSWQPLTGDAFYRSVAFELDAAIGEDDVVVQIWIRKNKDVVENMIVSIAADDSGDPDMSTLLGSDDPFIKQQLEAGIAECWSWKSPTSGTGSGLSSGTTYHLVVNVSVDSYDYWEIACQSGVGGKYSADGLIWTAGPAPYFRIYDGSNTASGKFFEYKGALYFVETPNSGNSRVLINGDRGAADSNAGALGTLVDATKSWTTNEFTGAIVMIIGGSGSSEKTPWREIVSNNATTLDVSPDWELTHSTTTEYVILESDVWKVRYTISSPVLSVSVAGEYCFFTERSGTFMMRRNERNLAGVWTVSSGSDSHFNAEYLRSIHNPKEGVTLWGAHNRYRYGGCSIFSAVVPQIYCASEFLLYQPVGILDELDTRWVKPYNIYIGHYHFENFLININAAFTTGTIAYKALDTPIDITKGSLICFAIRSSVATALGNLQLYLYGSDQQSSFIIPDYLFHYDTEGYPTFYMYDDSETGDDQWKKQGNAETPREQADISRVNFTLEADDKIYIGFTRHFDRVKWLISTAQTNVQTVSGEYWDGQAWTALANFNDGTVAGGATLAQNGDMTWDTWYAWNPGSHGDQASYLDQSLYWIRLTPSAALTNVKAELTVEDGQVSKYTALNRAKDGDTGTYETVSITADDYIYLGAANKFIYVNVNVGTVVNATASILSAELFDGENWTSVTITSDGTSSGGATLAKDGTIQLDAMTSNWAKTSIEGQEEYWVRFKVSADLVNASSTPFITLVGFSVDNGLDGLGSVQTLSLPALNANETTQVSLAINTWQSYNSLKAVAAMSIHLNTDLGAQTIELWGPMVLGAWGDYIRIGGRGERITGLSVHGSERSNLYVHTENNIYEVQSENDNAVVELPLEEIRTLRSIYNGRANCHNDVYLYFNLSTYLQRYVDGSLENIGPDKDEGLPRDRHGYPADLLSHPSRVLMSIDSLISLNQTPATAITGLDTVMARRGSGWHEVYRSPRLEDSVYGSSLNGNKPIVIEDIYFQSVYQGIDRLWIAQGGDLLWVPLVPDNPLNYPEFTYVPSGYLITGWFDGGFIDIEKTFTHLKIASENLASDAVTLTAQYQLESGEIFDSLTDSGWTDISDVFDTSPSQRIELQTATQVSARRIRFRIIFNTNDESITPVLKSTNLQAIFYHPVKEVYNLRYRSNDVGISVDGQPIYTQTAAVFDSTLKTWASPAPKILTLSCMHPSFNGKTVVVQYPSGKPFESDPSSEEAESIIRELVLMEI